MAKPLERKFQYILKDYRDNKYLGHMTSWFSDQKNAREYDVNDWLPMPDEQIFQNNSKRIRKCVVKRAYTLELSGITVLYLLPTNIEIECAGRIDGKKLFDEKQTGIDWSGSDGWLRHD